MRRRPLVLVVNDDGIEAPGIRALARAMLDLGDVVVVAPIEEQSAVGHSITIHEPIRAKLWQYDGELRNVRALGVAGTPSDCIKLALHNLLHRIPDLVVSGINKGANTAINVIYSGTVSAATESSVYGVDSIAFSLDSHDLRSDYGPSSKFAQAIALKVLRSRLPRGVVLNVNIPALPVDEIKGIQVTRQARSRWQEAFVERVDTFERPYYWYKGTLEGMDRGTDTDLHALAEGYVTITPLQYDLTAHGCLGVLSTWRWEEHVKRSQ